MTLQLLAGVRSWPNNASRRSPHKNALKHQIIQVQHVATKGQIPKHKSWIKLIKISQGMFQILIWSKECVSKQLIPVKSVRLCSQLHDQSDQDSSSMDTFNRCNVALQLQSALLNCFQLLLQYLWSIFKILQAFIVGAVWLLSLAGFWTVLDVIKIFVGPWETTQRCNFEPRRRWCQEPESYILYHTITSSPSEQRDFACAGKQHGNSGRITMKLFPDAIICVFLCGNK